MLNPKWRKFNLISGHNIFLTHHINLISHHSMSFSPSAGRKTALFRSLPRSQGRGQRLSDCVRSIEGLWLETMSSVNHPMCFFVYCHLFHRWNHDGVNCIKAVGVWEKKKTDWLNKFWWTFEAGGERCISRRSCTRTPSLPLKAQRAVFSINVRFIQCVSSLDTAAPLPHPV